MPSDSEESAFAFGPFVLIPERHLLLEDGAPVRIGKRALDILTALVQRPGDVVSKQELMATVWPNLVVEEGNLKVNIAALRRALRDDSDQPRFIATVVGRGYRFVTSVRSSEQESDSKLRTPPKLTHNLPKSSGRIFGRETTIASILHELQSSRLVSVVGPGGMGKTTVALAVARAALESFADGCWFVDLADLRDASLVADAVAQAVGVAPDALVTHLRSKKVLLILDNCEHVIDEAANVAHRLLATSAEIKLLVTSREPLCIRGERVRRLAGLSTPPSALGLGAAAALDFAAIQLFVHRAIGKSRSFQLVDDNAPAVAEICRKMDGLALSIECVALRADTLEVGQMLDYVETRAHLRDVREVGPERHRTLAAAVEWSYGLLSDREKAVLRRLSVFAGAFSLEAACFVGAADGAEPADVVEDVASLAAKSLLVVRMGEGEVEYRQLHGIRAFALEKLTEAGELEAARRRHADSLARAGAPQPNEFPRR